MQDNKPTTHQGDLAKLPRALAPLIERPQWAVWRWTQQANGRWQKPPFRRRSRSAMPAPRIPARGATTPPRWRRCRPGKADGITYMLTEDGSVRRDRSGSLPRSGHGSRSTSGRRISSTWPSHLCRSDAVRRRLPHLGFGGRRYDPVNRKFTLEIDGKQIAAELFRRTHKALTITGYRLDTIRELDQYRSGCSTGPWSGASAARLPRQKRRRRQINGHGFNGSGPGYSIDQIEQIVREGLRPAKIAATCSTQSSAITSAAAGASIRSWSTCSSSPTASAAAISARGGCQRDRQERRQVPDRALPLLDGWKALRKCRGAGEPPERIREPEPVSEAKAPPPEPDDAGSRARGR